MAGAKFKLWSPRDVVTLAAWLDFCLENDIQFERAILLRLEESRQSSSCVPYPFTILQVRNKLIDISRTNSKHHGGSEGPGYQQILATGSSLFFPWLGEDMKKMVREAFQKYGKTYLPQISMQSSAAESPATLTPKKRLGTARRATESNLLTLDISSRGLIPGAQPLLTNGEGSASRSETVGYAKERDAAGEGEGANELAKMKAQWDREVDTLSAERAELLEKNETLLAMVKDAESARHIRETMSMDPSESKIHSYHREIYDLGRRNKALQKEVPFFREIPDQPQSLSPTKINETMDNITYELDFMLHDIDCTGVTVMSVLSGSDLDSLIQSGLGLRQQATSLLLEECISKFGLTVVVRSLSLTAMRDWVFLTDYPNFTSDGISSSLLKWYRTIAYDIGDWKTLRNWDIAAYSRLLDSDQFKEILLPREAHRLADRLTKALDPIFHSRTSEEGRILGSKEVREDLSDHFTDMFKAGLNLKAASITTNNQYVFVVHPVGTTFLPEGPVDRGQRSSRRHASTRDNLSPISWMLASLKVFNPRNPNVLDHQGDALVQTRNFLRDEEDLGAIHCIHEKSITIEKSDSELPSVDIRVTETNAMLQVRNIAQAQGSNSEEQASPAVVEERPSLRTTVRKSTGGSSFVCDDCGSSFGTILNLQRHKLNKSCCRCKPCGEKFRTNSRLKNHLRSKHPRHTQTLKELGDQAESARPEPESILAHESRTTMTSETKIWKCATCTKTFTRKDSLVIHISRRACAWCLPCGIKYRYGRQLIKHQIEKHGREASPAKEIPKSSGSADQVSSPEVPHDNNIHSDDNFRQDVQAANDGGTVPTSAKSPGRIELPEGPTKPGANNLPQASNLAGPSPTTAGSENQVLTAFSKRKLTTGRDDGDNRAKRMATSQENFGSAQNVPKVGHAELRREPTPPTRHMARIVAEVTRLAAAMTSNSY